MNELTRRKLMQSAGVAGATAIGSSQLMDVVSAQESPTNEISGVVETESGPLENATVVAVPHDINNAVLETTTDVNGEYSFTESALYEGDNLYIVVAYAGSQLTPLRSEQNYPFVLANGGVAIPDSGVARWNYEENAADSWNGNDGSITGATYTTNSQIDEFALLLDGTDDYMTIPHSFGLFDGTVEFSFAAYANLNTIKQQVLFTPESENQFFLVWGDNVSNDQFTVRLNDGGTFENPVTSTTTFATGTWYHICATYGVSNGWTLYIDATNEAESSSSDNIASASNSTAIGAYGGLNDGFFDGRVDDARLYNKELTSTEVSNLFNTGSISG